MQHFVAFFATFCGFFTQLIDRLLEPYPYLHSQLELWLVGCL